MATPLKFGDRDSILLKNTVAPGAPSMRAAFGSKRGRQCSSCIFFRPTRKGDYAVCQLYLRTQVAPRNIWQPSEEACGAWESQ